MTTSSTGRRAAKPRFAQSRIARSRTPKPRITQSQTTARTPRTTRMTAVGAMAAVGLMLLAACGDQTKHSSHPSVPARSGGADSAAALLPPELRSKGIIRVGSDIAYPPVEFRDESGGTIGIDPDLAAALGKELGVTFRFENGTFDTLVTGLRSKRYDVAMSAMTDTRNRQNGVDPETGKKVGEGVDFVDYFTAGVSIYTRKGDDQGIRTWSDLCGKKIVVQRGTVSHNLAKTESKKCPNGRKIAMETFDNDLEAQTRLRSGGAAAGSSDFPVAAYAVKTSGGGKDFQLVGEQVEAAPYGIAVAKGNDQLTRAIQAALDAVIKSGEYGRIMAKWGVEAGAVTKAEVNGGS